MEKEKLSGTVEVKRGLNTKTLVIGIILVIITAFFRAGAYNIYAFARPVWYAYPYNFVWDKLMYSFGLAALMVLIIAIINQIKPVFSRQEVAVLLVMIVVSNFLTASQNYTENMMFFINYGMGLYSPGRPYAADALARMQANLADIMGLGKDKAYWGNSFSTWNTPMRWDYIMPMIVFASALMVVLCLVGLFSALFLRRLYIDVEALPFPIASIANDMVDLTQPSSTRVGFFKSKFFIVGFLVTVIWYFAYLLPVRYWEYVGWGTPMPYANSLIYGPNQLFTDATKLAILPWVTLYTDIEPFYIAWGSLLSIDVLVGFVIAWLAVQVIFPVVMTGIGQWPAFAPGQLAYMGVYRLYGQQLSVPIGNIMWLWLGMIIGLAVVPIVRNLGTMGPIFKGFVKEPAADVDPERPLPYRIALWGFIISLILYVAVSAVANVLSLWSFVWIVLVALCMLGSYRLIAETGGDFGHSFDNAFAGSWVALLSTIMLVTLPGVIGTTPTTPAMVMTFAFTQYGLSGTFALILASSGTITLESFKLGKLSSTNTKDMLKAALIAMVVFVVVITIGNFIWHSIFPGNQWAGAVYPWLGSMFFNGYSTQAATGPLTPAAYWFDNGLYQKLLVNPGPTDSIGKMIIGIVVIAVVTIGRERLPWLRVSAAGLVLGVFGGQWFWAPFIIALVIKYVIMRVGGTELFLKKWKPLAVGLIVGFFFVYLINGLIYVPAMLKGTYK